MNPVLKSMPSLVQLSLNTVVDNLNNFMVEYNEKWMDITSENRPQFGPFGPLKSSILTIIIEELIKRELLDYVTLRVLLPEIAERLRCDENTRYSPFGCNTIELISKRCPNFKVLHCHYDFVSTEDGVLIINLVLSASIQRLPLLQEIDFCDTSLKKETIQIISLNCHQLRKLNLRRTNVTDEELDYLVEEESVLKNSLTNLIISETNVSPPSILQCLLNLPNLTHFLSDKTIEASLILFERLKGSAEVSDAVSKFKTKICRSKIIGIDTESLTKDFCLWIPEIFPKVKHLIISLNEVYEELVCCVVMSWNENITTLELSSCSNDYPYYGTLQITLSYLEQLFSLKIENFYNLDVFYLAKCLKKLKKLSLINNTYLRKDKIQPFENLKEVEVTIFEDKRNSSFKLYENYMHMPNELLLSILCSKKVEKVLLYKQTNLTNDLMSSLLNTNNLRSLKELKVFKSPIEMGCILEIFDQAIPIKNIVVGFCDNISEDDAKEISTYIKNKNLAASFTLVSEDPYNLRWIPLNVEVSV